MSDVRVIDQPRLGGNRPPLRKPKTRKLFMERIIVVSNGTPTRFPDAVPVSDVLISSTDNTGTCYLGASFLEASDAKHRFSIKTGDNFILPFKVDNLDEIWLDAVTDNDAISIMTYVEVSD